ncbi:hypothetical protein HDC93_006312 [Streptomyces sp. AK010]|nr:hypothetical protein [Streptomyces sp. AK010]
MYWVTPRHLAGDDGVLAERIGDTLASLGWSMWPTARHTLLHVSPDGLRGAEWILASYPFELGGLPVAWQLSARPHGASAMAEWNAYFTAGVPYEALVDLLVALDAREAPEAGFERPDTVLRALSDQGWIRDVDRPRTTAMDPGCASCVSLEMLPPFIQDADPRPDLMGWQAWAEPVLGAPYLWCASFSASVPHDLVAAFASSLASPVPVPAALSPRAWRAGSPWSAAADDPMPPEGCGPALWRLHLRSGSSLADLAREINPVVRGWINYYGRFYPSALVPSLKGIDHYLMRWAMQKYKRLRRRRSRAWQGLEKTARLYPGLFAHWKLLRPRSTG